MTKLTAKLTKTAVEGIKPIPGKQVVVFDSDLKGFGIRVSAGGTKTFFVQGRIRGNQQPVKATVGQFGTYTAEKARKQARDKLYAMSQGEDPRLSKEKQEAGHTFGDLMEAYVKMLEDAEKSSARLVKNQIKKDIEGAYPKLWKKAAAEITIDDVVTIIGKLNDEGSYRQADKIRSYIKTAFKKAINARGNVKAPKQMRELKITHNPANDIEKVEGSTNASERALSLAEFRAYWSRIQELEEPRRSVAMLHVLTGGQRMQQLSRVTLADIDRDAMLMRMEDGKGRRTKPRIYSVPLLPQTLECIDAITGSGEYVFSADGGATPMHTSYISDIATSVCSQMDKAGELEGTPFTGKVIRATIETRLMKAPYRVSSDILARLLSHGLGGVQAKHYAHDQMHDEQVEALEKLWRLLEEKPEPVAQVLQFVREA
ncbi:MAG: integrase family protein [Pseudohongiellaceae bacterium]